VAASQTVVETLAVVVNTTMAVTPTVAECKEEPVDEAKHISVTVDTWCADGAYQKLDVASEHATELARLIMELSTFG
jgi:hypothetical protein